MKYKFLIGTLLFAVLLLISPLNDAQCVASAFCFWGLLACATPAKRRYCYDAAAPPVLSAELETLFREIGANWGNVKGLIDRTKNWEANIATMKPAELEPRLVELAKGMTEVRSELDKWKKGKLKAIDSRETINPALGKYVSDDCARFLVALAIQAGEMQGKLSKNGAHERERLCVKACEIFGLEQRSTLTTSDIPMPTDFGSQVVELVWMYGQARRYGTVYPLPGLTTKLPKLGTSPAFGLIAAAATVPEKSPTFTNVTFTAEKWGGLIRMPSEIDADSIVPLGNFLARYIARETAKIEDTVYWIADGTATYDSLSGLLKQGSANSCEVVQTGGSVNADGVTLQNLRDLRAEVNIAALVGPGVAYYMNPTFESKLCTFNTSATVVPYIANGANGPTLDGYPIRWVGVLPGRSATTAAQNTIGFGDPTYHYLGVRQGLEVVQSRDVFFATDEIALRALERFTTGLMASDAFGTITTAAS